MGADHLSLQPWGQTPAWMSLQWSEGRCGMTVALGPSGQKPQTPWGVCTQTSPARPLRRLRDLKTNGGDASHSQTLYFRTRGANKEAKRVGVSGALGRGAGRPPVWSCTPGCAPTQAVYSSECGQKHEQKPDRCYFGGCGLQRKHFCIPCRCGAFCTHLAENLAKSKAFGGSFATWS